MIRIGVFIHLIILTLTFLSCNKDNSFDPSNPNDPSSFASVSVFNAIPKSEGVAVSVGHKKAERNMVAFGNNVSYGDYFGYRNWFAGSWDLFIENREGEKLESSSHAIALEYKKSYSLFTYRQETSISHVLSEDNILLPKEGFIKIRMAHFLEGLNKGDLFLVNSNRKLFQEINFAEVTDYVEVNLKELNGFKVISSKGGVALEYNTDNITLVNKGIYTLLLKGSLYNSSGKENEDFIKIIKQY